MSLMVQDVLPTLFSNVIVAELVQDVLPTKRITVLIKQPYVNLENEVQ